MKSTGVCRRVDELGRIVIPVELRRTLGIEIRDPLEIFTENNTIILRKYEPACVFCGNSKDIISIKGRNICGECISELRKMA